MPHTIFWSWQSDISARETRGIIREALVDAIAQVAASVEDAQRPEIDHDTKGVPGTPEIASTILSKIEAATIFVGDVTPITVSESGKHVANPNVMIELGYAKKALTPARMILVWNTAIHDSKPEDLPFDLRHRRGPIHFNLPVGAGKAELRSARIALTEAFVGAIGDILGNLLPVTPEELPWHKHAGNHEGVWIENSHGLPVNRGMSEPAQISIDDEALGFARMLPSEWSPRPDALAVLDHATQHPIPLGRYGGLDWGPATAGFLVYRHSTAVEESGFSTTATRWFRQTGEFWGVDSQFCREDGDHRFYSELYAAERWHTWLKQTSSLLQILGGKHPFNVILGIEGMRATRWARGNYGGSTPQALEDRARYEFRLGASDEIREHVLSALNKVRDAFGIALLTEAGFEELARGFLS